MNIDELFKDTEEVRPRLVGIARKIVGDDDVAEDIVQDALLRLWQVRAEIRNADAMARIITRNLSIDYVRRKHITIDINACEMDIATPPDNEEQIERVMKLIGKLPTMQQTVIRLRHVDGLKMSEIAKITGTTEQAVRQSISRARRTILKNYNNKGL